MMLKIIRFISSNLKLTSFIFLTCSGGGAESGGLLVVLVVQGAACWVDAMIHKFLLLHSTPLFLKRLLVVLVVVALLTHSTSNSFDPVPPATTSDC